MSKVKWLLLANEFRGVYSVWEIWPHVRHYFY